MYRCVGAGCSRSPQPPENALQLERPPASSLAWPRRPAPGGAAPRPWGRASGVPRQVVAGEGDEAPEGQEKENTWAPVSSQAAGWPAPRPAQTEAPSRGHGVGHRRGAKGGTGAGGPGQLRAAWAEARRKTPGWALCPGARRGWARTALTGLPKSRDQQGPGAQGWAAA